MTTYTVIADSEIDPESPGTTTLFTKLRNNPIAITEGALNAPRVEGFAINAALLDEWFGDGSDGDLVISASAGIAPGEYNYNDLTINSGIDWTVNAQGALIIRVLGTLTLAGNIIADNRGANYGAGGDSTPSTGAKGTNGSLGGGGGGGGGVVTYAGGGVGGSDTSVDATGGTGGIATGGAGASVAADKGYIKGRQFSPLVTYWDTSVQIGGCGGGGGGGGTSTGGRGGYGGGVVIIIAREIIFTGSISADGEAGTVVGTGSTGNGGGGGGGCIIMASPTWTTDTGTLSVAGGLGGVGAGANGGNGGAGYSRKVTL